LLQKRRKPAGPVRVYGETEEASNIDTAEADTTRQAPEIQTMYSLNLPVSTLRTKIRQEFERHRYVNQMKTVDVLLFNSHQEFQETLNYWKQVSHVLKYFRAEEDPKARLPANFINGFLEVRLQCHALHAVLTTTHRDATDRPFTAWG
jgi:NADH dehydrogenase (ubiquinone) 1 alpha subcomplex subunit 6